MSETNKRTIRIVREEAMRKGKLDKLGGLYADDYIYHGIPMLGDMRGPTAFRNLVSGFIDAVSGFQETVEDQLAEGDKVVTRVSGRGKHTGELMGVAPSGNDLRWTAIIISRFVNGKIAEEWAEFDALSFSQQLSGSAR
ncbi:MAG TPA: ester cyclase [Vicinamibacterales bacterium]|nr:ester cyclase [Vicinamibacterales bacterium]